VMVRQDEAGAMESGSLDRYRAKGESWNLRFM
jgi:hypothetical protein